jgi:hypothetical protein
MPVTQQHQDGDCYREKVQLCRTEKRPLCVAWGDCCRKVGKKAIGGWLRLGRGKCREAARDHRDGRASCSWDDGRRAFLDTKEPL